MARGNGSGGAAAFEPEELSLADLRARTSAPHLKVVKAAVAAFERRLLEKFPEVQAGVASSAASGSFTATLEVRKAKKGRFVGALKARVRTPIEPIEFDLHIGRDGQLSLGLPAGWEGDGAGSAKGKAARRDDDEAEDERVDAFD